MKVVWKLLQFKNYFVNETGLRFSPIETFSESGGLPLQHNIFSSSGSATATISSIMALSEEIMCSLGYTNEFSGLCSAMVVIGGMAGAVFFGYLLHLFPDRILTIGKSGLILIAAVMAGLMVVMNMPNQAVLFATGYTSLGFLSIG